MLALIDWEVVLGVCVVGLLGGVGSEVADDALLSPVAIKELQALV